MLKQEFQLTDIEQLAWAGLVSKGISKAISGLSEMVGQTMKVTALNPVQVPLKDVPDLFGGPEELAVGIYLSISGSANGHILLVYKPKIAFELVDLLMEEALGTTNDLDEIETSALGEMGNIMGSFFLNSLADHTGLSLQPSPPVVIMDMAGAILDIALADMMMYSDVASIIDAAFGTDDQQVTGSFLVLPTPDLLVTLSQQWRNS
ncbi:MAG: chemotaxis protein CheC [Chloroflexota bacterium]|nr:chemotaxis protein CheC [Chloroflexota bacterium]